MPATTATSARGTERAIRRVLLVDDDASVLQSFPPVLASLALDVVTAAGPEEARAILEELEIDLVITDLRLRGRSDTEGLELLSWIKQRNARVDVVLMTGYGAPAIRDEALSRGAADYWEKSLPVAEMVGRLRGLGVA